MEFSKQNLFVYCGICVAVTWIFTVAYLNLTGQFPSYDHFNLIMNGIWVMAFVGIAIGMIIPPILFRQHDDLTWLYHVGIISITLMLVFISLYFLLSSLLISAIL